MIARKYTILYFFARNVSLFIRDLQNINFCRYLVVIDDVWSTQAWKIIKCSLFLNDLGSRIMTTTRSIDIAKSCCSPHQDRVYEIKPLTAANSKSLFAKRVFGSGDIFPPRLEAVSLEILKKCGGSPLAMMIFPTI